MAQGNQMQKRQDSGSDLTTQTAARVNAMIAKNKDAIIQSLPKGFDSFNRMQRNIINAISTNPYLAECTPDSLFLSSVQAFAVGLEIGGVQGYAHLVPFWNSKKRCKEAKFMPDWKGLVDVARRSGDIKLVYADKVCEKDEFTYERGTTPTLEHKPNVFGDRGDAKGYYAVVVFKDDTKDFEAMSIEDILKVAHTSSTYKNGSFNGPWRDHFDEMAKKTVLKRLLKRCPMSIDLQKAVDADHKVSMGDEDSGDIIDVPGLVIDDEDKQLPDEAQKAINEQAKEKLKERITEKKADEGPTMEGDGDQIPDLGPSEEKAEDAPPPKRITKTQLMKATGKVGAPDSLIKAYCVACNVLTEDQTLDDLPNNWKQRIVESPDSFKKALDEWDSQDDTND